MIFQQQKIVDFITNTGNVESAVQRGSEKVLDVIRNTRYQLNSPFAPFSIKDNVDTLFKKLLIFVEDYGQNSSIRSRKSTRRGTGKPEVFKNQSTLLHYEMTVCVQLT